MKLLRPSTDAKFDTYFIVDYWNSHHGKVGEYAENQNGDLKMHLCFQI